MRALLCTVHAARSHLRGNQSAVDSERGASTIETVIIAAALAALALGVMAAITVLVNGKLASIHL